MKLWHRNHASAPERLPAHVGVVMDGNRRWARSAGHASPSVGHQYGADHVNRLLEWCGDWAIDHVTVFVLSADNIRKRAAGEVGYLFGLLDDAVPRMVTENSRWALHVTGDLGLVPAATAAALRDAEFRTAGRSAHFTMAIGYDGRADIVAGIRGALRTHGAQIDTDAITAGLPGGPVKDVDLVIRTSGERRLSGFLPWQTTRAEIFVSPKMWPAFTSDDFTAALRYYSAHALRLWGRGGLRQGDGNARRRSGAVCRIPAKRGLTRIDSCQTAVCQKRARGGGRLGARFVSLAAWERGGPGTAGQGSPHSTPEPVSNASSQDPPQRSQPAATPRNAHHSHISGW